MHQPGLAAPLRKADSGFRQEQPVDRARRHTGPLGPGFQRARVARCIDQTLRDACQAPIGGQRQVQRLARCVAQLVKQHRGNAPAFRREEFVNRPGDGAPHERAHDVADANHAWPVR